MSWTSSCEAGAQNTPAMPWIVSSTTACQTWSVSVRNSTPQPSEHSMNSSMPNWMIRRESKRSVSAPDQIENNRNGSQCEITAKPASAGEWNFS